MAFAEPDIYGPYYIQRGEWGGYSPCIEGNNAHNLRPFDGSVLPNCVGYIVGRFNEVMDLGDCVWLGSVDAKDMLDLAISQGLKWGNKPVPGGIICWDSDEDGHAAFIEEVIDSTEVITSESGWNYTREPIVRNYTRYRYADGFHYARGYDYQGIIYPPGVSFSDRDYYIMFMQEGAIKL